MNYLSQALVTFALRRLLSRACESAVPRSGERGAKVNCFITKIHQGDDPPPVVLALEGSELVCIAWDGRRYTTDRRIQLNQVKLSQFDITHFYGLSEVRYSGLLAFIVGRITAWPYIKIHTVLFISRINQHFFNKKKLVTKRRMKLLSFLVDRHLSGQTDFDPIDLMTDLYTLRWVEHPDRDSAIRQLESYLDAMIDTGELAKTSDGYRVTGQALRTIEEYEEQERRHVENVRMQRAMFWLTLAMRRSPQCRHN